MNPKNPTSREKQEHEDSGHAVYRSWCAACVDGRGVGGQYRIELLEEEERDRTTPIVAFDYGFLTQEIADTFPILICRDSRYGKTGATCCERKGPTAHSISLLVGFIKDLGFRRIILKCDDGSDSARTTRGAREVKRQCRTLRISAEQNTSVRIADDSPLLSWLPRFAAQVMNKMRIGKDGKTSEMRRTGRRWKEPMAQFGENVWFRKIGEDGVSSFASRMAQGIFVGHHDRTVAVLCISKNGVARQKLDKTDTA